MNHILSGRKRTILLLLPLSVFIFTLSLCRLPFVSESNQLINAISLDLILTIPLLYFLFIRKSSIPKTTVIPVLFLCVFSGSLLLPSDKQQVLSFFKNYGLPIIELGVLAIIVFKTISFFKVIKENHTLHFDFYDALLLSAKEVLPLKVATIVCAEIGMIYYGVFKWKKTHLKENEFSYHKRSGTITLFSALIFIVLIETFAVHILLHKWHPILAWILSGLSIYSTIQLWGYAKSVPYRPIRIENNGIEFQYGIMNKTSIAYDNIDSVELTRKRNTQKDQIPLSLIGEFEGHNTIIYLKNENTLESIFGMKKKYSSLTIHLDDPQKFLDQLQDKLNHNID